MAKNAMPVLVGAGQAMSQWDGSQGANGAPSPLSLMAEAAKAAFGDCGAATIASAIDAVVVARIFEDSTRADRHPHGHNTNLPGTLARETGTKPGTLIYESVGGQSPQALVNEMAGRIHAGEFEAVLIAGSEANRASKGAMRHGLQINWADEDAHAFEDRGMGPMLLSRSEIKHGLVLPALFYGLFENALAAREGRSRSQHRAAMAKLFRPFTEVSAKNRYSQFPVARDEAFLATPSKENYEYADPYLKWFMAQDAVNQGAALIVMSDEKADALGIAKSKRVYLHGGGEASDDHLTERPVLDRSWAMDVAAKRALDQAELTSAAIKHFDLYSCFPVAVFSGCAALGLDWKNEKRPLTLTGGLPFFGGPGNNYSMHGIAEMVAKLRNDPGAKGFVLANGGWMTKEAAGVYATEAPKKFVPAEPYAKPAAKIDLCVDDCEGKLETFTVMHGKAGPEAGMVLARLADGRRAIANVTPEGLAILREDKSPVGRSVRISVNGETGQAAFT